MSEKAVDPYYKARAKEITDIMFNKRLLADDLSREAISGLEDFLGAMFQGYCDSAVTVDRLSRSVRRPRSDPKVAHSQP